MRREGTYSQASSRYARRARKWARVLSYIPFSRGYILTGSVARGTARAESDIDFIVIADARFVWLHRALLFIFLSVCASRRTPRTHAGKICICASVSEKGVLKPLAPSGDLLWRGSSRFIFLEHLFVVTGLAMLAEYVARTSISRYISRQLEKVRSHPHTVVRLLKDHIEYYPPRKGALGTLDGLSASARVSARY